MPAKELFALRIGDPHQIEQAFGTHQSMLDDRG
jgi:hypothetical protein